MIGKMPINALGVRENLFWVVVRVYVSADTLGRDIPDVRAQQRALLKV